MRSSAFRFTFALTALSLFTMAPKSRADNCTSRACIDAKEAGPRLREEILAEFGVDVVLRSWPESRGGFSGGTISEENAMQLFPADVYALRQAFLKIARQKNLGKRQYDEDRAIVQIDYYCVITDGMRPLSFLATGLVSLVRIGADAVHTGLSVEPGKITGTTNCGTYLENIAGEAVAALKKYPNPGTPEADRGRAVRRGLDDALADLVKRDIRLWRNDDAGTAITNHKKTSVEEREELLARLLALGAEANGRTILVKELPKPTKESRESANRRILENTGRD